MTDREKLLTALLRESDRRAGAEVSVVDVIAMLDQLGAAHASRRRKGTNLVAASARGHRRSRISLGLRHGERHSEVTRRVNVGLRSR